MPLVAVKDVLTLDSCHFELDRLGILLIAPLRILGDTRIEHDFVWVDKTPEILKVVWSERFQCLVAFDKPRNFILLYRIHAFFSKINVLIVQHLSHLTYEFAVTCYNEGGNCIVPFNLTQHKCRHDFGYFLFVPQLADKLHPKLVRDS